MTAGLRRTRSAFRPVNVPQVKPGEPGDSRVNRALDDLVNAVNALGAADEFVGDVDLAVGTTTIAHGLNRRPVMVQVAPLVASAGFAWGWDPDQPGNPRPTMQTQITSATAAMARIRVE